MLFRLDADLRKQIEGILPRYPTLPLFIIRNNLRLLDISVERYLNILEEL